MQRLVRSGRTVGATVRLRSVIVLAVAGVLALAGTISAAKVGSTTINLRAWDGSSPLDGVNVCLEQRHTVTCGGTEDGELWVDSLPAGPYRAWVEPPPGHDLASITCTTFPDAVSTSCRVRGNEVRLVVKRDAIAVNINFNFIGT